MHGRQRTYSFGEYTLDLGRGALLKAGVEVKLRPKSFGVLRLLVERHGELVTKDEFINAVWGRVVVTDGALIQCLIDVRRAIGDESQQVIRTVPRRGYLFDAPVVETNNLAGTAATEPLPSTAVPERDHRSRRWAVVVAGITALTVMATLAWRDNHPAAGDDVRQQVQPKPAPVVQVAPPNSIAVLPFVNMSPEPDQEYFSDGISEEILNALAQSPELRVIARTSSFAFKRRRDASIADIAAKLNVAYVLEGSVRKAGDQIRITAQLVNGADSAHVWSQTYDRKVQDALAVQTDIASRVTDALKVQLTPNRRAAAGAGAPTGAAHDAYLRAKFFYNRRGPGDADKARAYFEEALRIEPAYARAWIGLAAAYDVQSGEGTIPADIALEKRRHAVERALAIDPNLAEVQACAAGYYLDAGDEERAIRHVRQAYALDRNDPAVQGWLSIKLAFQHRFDEWIAMQRRFVSADPVSAVARINFANYLMTTGHLDEARSEFTKAVELNPDFKPGVEVDLVRILILERRFDEALERVQRWPPGDDRDQALAMVRDGLGQRTDADAAVLRLVRRAGTGNAVRLAEIYAQRGEPDEAFRWMSTAYDRLGKEPWQSPDGQWLWTLNLSPFLVPLFDDPRWSPLAARGWPPGAEAVYAAVPDDLG